MNLKKITLLGLIVGCVLSCKHKPHVDEPPNLLFIFTDQHRRASLGFLNEDPVYTPNIDKLAKDGVFFSHAVSNHPLCSPYRAMLMTGKYPLSNGVIENCNSANTPYGNFLKKKEVCFSDVLVSNGYSAGYVGKWHLDGPPATTPGVKRVWDTWCPPENRHGFSYWYAYGTHNRHNTPYYWDTDGGVEDTIFVNQWSPEHEAEIIMKYIDNAEMQRAEDKPFALFWSINPPHTPFNQVPDKYRKRYAGMDYKDVLNRPNVEFTDNYSWKKGDKGVDARLDQAPDYFACVEGVDDQIGRVIEYLKETGLYENTIIVFTADHGEMLGSHGLMHKNVWFREAMDIPLIVHFPKSISAKTDDLLLSVPDYMPTILGLMGLGDKVPGDVEGKDYSNVFFDKPAERPTKQLYFGTKPNVPHLGARGFRTYNYTFSVFKDDKGEKFYYLFNDQKDPYQMKNCWGDNTNLDKQMEEELTTLLKSMNDPW